jgi:hypothetical protein
MSEKLPMGGVILQRRAKDAQFGQVKAEIVLVHLKDNNCTPYVTWQRNIEDGAVYWGHYFTELRNAKADFANR